MILDKVNYYKLFILISVFLLSCTNVKQDQVVCYPDRSNTRLDQIHARGTLVAATQFNSVNYFVYRGEPMGFQYELLQDLAANLDVKLEIVVAKDLDEAFDLLQSGKCDLIASNLTVTKQRLKKLNFTKPILETKQVLVQKSPSKISNQHELIRNQLDLGGKEIYLPVGTVYSKRILSLSEEIGDTIYVSEMPDYNEDDIIKLVSDGEIQFTVCDEIIAMVNKTYYTNIDIETAISFPQRISWAVHKDETVLLKEINDWLIDYLPTLKYRLTYNKYFRNSRTGNMLNSEYFSLNSGKVSKYDELFKIHSQLIHWDWKLLASMVFQESSFNPTVKSWSGAFGLMQLMPATAERYGVDSLSTPEENIKAGVQYISWLQSYWRDIIPDPIERNKFVLASYNAGVGHVLDARRLAEKYDKDPNVWTNNVDDFLKMKSHPDYYNDPVVKYGYCRGDEPYNYVAEVYERFEHYKNICKE